MKGVVEMAVLNINTISGSMADRIDRSSGSMAEKLERFKDSSINMGRQSVHTGSMAETGMLRQTEGYQGYSKTLRPASSVVQAGTAVVATMSAIQFSRDYRRFNKEYGEEIQKHLNSLKPSEKAGAVISNVEDKVRTVNKDTFNVVASADKFGNVTHRTEVVREKVKETYAQKPITVGDWNKGTLFSTKLNNNINIAATHSRTRLRKDGVLHSYRHNPARAASQAKKLETELTRRAIVRNVETDNVNGGRLAIFKAHRAMKVERGLDADLARRIEKHSSKLSKYKKNDATIKAMYGKMQAARGKVFKNHVAKEYDNTKLASHRKRKIKTKEDIIKNAGKKVNGVKAAKGAGLSDGDLLLQAAGKKAMAAKGVKAMARRKSLRSLSKAHTSILRTTGVTKNNDFGEGYLVMGKVTWVAKPLVNKMTINALKKMLIQSKRIATRVVKQAGIQTISTGVHAYNSYKLAKNGGVAPAKNLKTARAMFKNNQSLAKEQTKNDINLAKKKTKGAVQKKITDPLKKKLADPLKKKVTQKLTAPLRKFILNSLNKFKNTAFAKGTGALGRGIGKVLGGIGKVIGFALKPFLALFRGLAAVFSTISSFIFGVAFAYAAIFALIMASGSLLSGVFGIFDSISNVASEAWSNTDPNVNYAVDEIQDASNELSNITKTQENVAVISTIIDKLPTSQLWRKLTKQETETCAGYDIVLVGDTDYYILEIPSADNTVNVNKINIKKNSKGMLQENDREILSIVSNLYESYGGISNTFNIGKQIEKSQWKTLVQQLYILSHNTNMRKEAFIVNNYSVNYWTGVSTVTSSSTYYKWLIEVEIMRGTDFFNKCGDIALEAGKKIDPDIDITSKDELLDWYIASMEKEELWDENSDIKYKGYEFTYFDATDGILARIANNFKSTPQSQYTYEYSNPPENVYIVNNDSDSSFEYVRIVQEEDGSYDTTGGIFKVSDGSLSVGTIFTSDKDGNPSKKEQEYIEMYLEENGIEIEENTTENSSSTNNTSNTSSGKTNTNNTNGQQSIN